LFFLNCGRFRFGASHTGVPRMPCFYLSPEKDDFNSIPELQVCLAEALYDIESILPNPTIYPEQELCRLRDQIISNLERAWEITGRGENELTAMILQISQIVAKQLEE
jgi:hypothetical protein